MLQEGHMSEAQVHAIILLLVFEGILLLTQSIVL